MMLMASLQMMVSVSAQVPLTLAMILTGLQTKGTTPETSTLAKRNVFITKRVEANGVTFRLTPEIEKELRNAGATAALITAIRLNGPAAPTPTPRTTTTRPSAVFKDLWVDYDVTEGGQNGMRIHVKFTTYNMRNLNSYLAIYFLNSRTSSPLKDRNNKLASTSGDVAVYREMTPIYDATDFNDLTVFMPYDEFDLGDGNWDLEMDVKLIYKQGGLIQDLTRKKFNYKQGDVVDKDNSSVTAKVNRVWVDYNVTDSGRKGMRIHVNFEVTGLKGIDSRLVARVQKEDETYLMNSRSGFSNDAGQLQVAFKMKPGYATTVYEDATMFLPYSEIILQRGSYDLKLDIDLNDGDDELIKHLTFYDFQFDRS